MPLDTDYVTETRLNTLLEKLEARTNAQEELIANLMMGYVELAVAVEQCMHKILEPLNEQDRLEFGRKVYEQKEELLNVINRMAQNNGSTVESSAPTNETNTPPGE